MSRPAHHPHLAAVRMRRRRGIRQPAPRLACCRRQLRDIAPRTDGRRSQEMGCGRRVSGLRAAGSGVGVRVKVGEIVEIKWNQLELRVRVGKNLSGERRGGRRRGTKRKK